MPHQSSTPSGTDASPPLGEAELAAAALALVAQPRLWAPLRARAGEQAGAALQAGGGPWTLYWSARLHPQLEPAVARERLALAFERFEAGADRTGALLAAAAAIDTFYVDESALQPLDPWIARLHSLLPEGAAQEALWPSREVQAQVMACGLAITLRDQTHPLLARWAPQATTLVRELPRGALRTRLATFVLQYQLWRGGFANAWALLEALPGLDGSELPPAEAMAWHESVATLARLAGEPERGRREIAAALALAASEGLHGHLYALHSHGAAIELFALDVPAAQAHLDAMKPLVAAQPPEDQGHYWHYHAGIALARGDAATAVAHARTALDSSRHIGGPYRSAAHHHSLALALLAAGQHAAALEAFDEALVLADGIAAGQLVSSIRLHRAAALAGLGRQAQADAALAAALAEINARGYRTASGWLLPAIQARLMARALVLPLSEAVHAGVRRWIALHALPGPDPLLAAWPWPLALRGLGGFAVTLSGEPLERGAGVAERPLDLLRALLAVAPAPLPVATAMAWLWPDDRGDPRKAFDVALLRLRRLLGEAGSALRLEAGRLLVDPGRGWADSGALAQWLDEPLPVEAPATGPGADPPGGLAELQRRAQTLQALARGPLLPEVDAPWAQAARTRLRQRLAAAAGHLADALAVHDEAAALSLVQTLFERDPVSESLARRLMRQHVAAGRPGEAAQVFHLLTAMCQLGSGLPPAPETRSLAVELGLVARA
jgi:DNA-binding SARP family transcriptional activator